MEHINLAFYKAPFLFFCASGFYVSLFVSMVFFFTVPAFKTKITTLFSIPVPSTGKHIPALDTLRGIAVIGVASFHTWQWLKPFNDGMSLEPIKQGYKGVVVFVVLSGFLIYRSLTNRCNTAADISIYLKRRFLRIYPLYLVTSLTVLAMGLVSRSPSLTQNFLAAVFMMYPLKHPLLFNPPSWSLYVEVIFYLTLPLWVISARKRALLFASVSFVIFSLTGNEVPHELQIFRYFFVGIIVSEILDKTTVKSATALAAFLAGAGMFWLDFSGYDIFSVVISKVAGRAGIEIVLNTYPYCSITLGVALGLMLYGIIGFRPINAFLGFYPFRYVGIISYSIFLWHSIMLIVDTTWDFGKLAKLTGYEGYYEGRIASLALLYIPAFIFVSSISYAVIEKPFQKLRSVK